jgi:acid phosphatase (class A)
MTADEGVFQETRALQGSPRWRQAARDADLDMPGALRAFECVAGARLTPQSEPTLVRLMTRVMTDISHSYSPAKDHYARRRPFKDTDAPICVEKDKKLVESYSYPSGHSSIGYAWALILAELEPDRTAQIVKRGKEFGDSRVVCGVHYLSDVQAGRLVASAVTARLNADPAFEADLARARAELAAARTNAPPDAVQCAAETQALETPAY